MNVWRDTKKLWSDAWARSPLQVVIGVTCMLALLAGALVVLSDSSDASATPPMWEVKGAGGYAAAGWD